MKQVYIQKTFWDPYTNGIPLEVSLISCIWEINQGDPHIDFRPSSLYGQEIFI